MYEDKRRQLRKRFVEKTINTLRMIGLPDKITGFLLKTMHFHTPWYFLLFFLLFPKPLAVLALVPMLHALFLFFFLKGCFLTIVEYKLCGDDTNIIDPYIILTDAEVNATNRYNYTLIIAIIYFIIVFIILYLRNCLNKDILTKCIFEPFG